MDKASKHGRGHIHVLVRHDIYEAIRKHADAKQLPIATWARLVLTAHAKKRKLKIAA